jgi:hypothetical protein
MGQFAGQSIADRNWTAQPAASPTAGGTVTPDMALGALLQVTMPAGNITIANPSNGKIGDFLHLRIKQDTIGGRLVTWDTLYLKSVVLSLTALATDQITFRFWGDYWIQVASALNLI